MAQDRTGRDPVIDKFLLAALNIAAKKQGYEIVAAKPTLGQNNTSETTLFKKATVGGHPEKISNGHYSTYPGQQQYLIAYQGDGWPAVLTWEWLGNKPHLTLEVSAGRRYMRLTDSGETPEELGQSKAMERLVMYFLNLKHY